MITIELFANKECAHSKVANMLRRGERFFKTIFKSPEVTFIYGDRLFILNEAGGWEELPVNDVPLCDRVLVVLDLSRRINVRGIIALFCKYGDDGVWFMTDKCVPYRLSRREFKTFAVRKRFAFSGSIIDRVIRKLLKVLWLIPMDIKPLKDLVERELRRGNVLQTLLERESFVDYADYGKTSAFYVPYIYIMLFVENILKHRLSGTIVELGCGNGIQSLLFSIREDNARIISVDRYQPRLDNIVLCGRANISPVLATSSDLPIPPDSADYVFMSEALQHFTYWKKTLDETYRILKQNGCAIIDEVNLASLAAKELCIKEGPFNMEIMAACEYERNALLKSMLPDVSMDIVETYAKATVGLEEHEIREWINSSMSNSKLEQIVESKKKEEEYFERRYYWGMCNERFFHAEQLSDYMHRIGFRNIAIVYHISSRIKVPRCLRNVADRMLILAIK